MYSMEAFFQKIARKAKGKRVFFRPHEAYEEQIEKRLSKAGLEDLAGAWPSARERSQKSSSRC